MNKVLKFFEKIDLSYVLLILNISLLAFIFLLNSTIAHEIGDLKQIVEIHNLNSRVEIYNLTETLTDVINSIIANDKNQIQIDKQQQLEIKDLTKLLINLGEIVIDNDIKQLKVTKKITGIVEELQNTVLHTKSRLKEMKIIDLDNVENIKKANVLIVNTTAQVEGSGSHIKIKGENYILTCAHLIKEDKDFIWAILDTGTWHPLELIKIDKEKDLALFKVFMVEDLPYLEISDKSPKEGSEVILIGNPADLEDVITNGILAKIEENNYLFTNLNYYGNSGGALLYKGKIVGVISASLSYIRPFLTVHYGCSSKLEQIREFLGK